MAFWSLKILMKASFYYKKDKYSDLVRECLGKNFEFFLEITMILATFGALTAYLITISNFIPTILNQFKLNNLLEDKELQRKLVIVITSLVLFPICCKRRLHEI